MNITYILSQYPARSETFIAREMRELVRRGDDLTIARLRWSDTGSGMRVEDATVLDLHWNPIDWLLGLGWGIAKAPRVILRIGRDIGTAATLSSLWWRLLVLALVALALGRSLRRQPPDHLRAHLLDSEAIVARWLSQLLGVPYSVTIHTLTTRFPPPLLRRTVEDASFCATISQETKHMVEALASQTPPVRLIRNGVRIPVCPSRSQRTSSPVRLLIVGRLIEKKGFDVLLDACSLLRAWIRPFQCTVIGDGPLRPSLEDQARQQGLTPFVTFHGAQPNEEVLRAIRRHDILAMPSRPTETGDRDGIPTVLIEAMAHGTFVVASAFAAIPELIADGETGRLVPPGDPEALARALARAVDRPQEVARMRMRGRARIVRDFNLAREVGTLQTLIRSTTQ